MIEFQPVTLTDKTWIDEIVMSENSRSADFNFGNIYLWNRLYCQTAARIEHRMITRLENVEYPYFAFPIGTGDLSHPIRELMEYSLNGGFPLNIYGLEEKNVRLLDEAFPGCFEFTLQTRYSDYIYETGKLASFNGHSYHRKRNYCHRFESKHPDWIFVPITKEIIPLCRDMLNEWEEKNRDRLEDSITYEHAAILTAFSEYDDIGLEGGALFDGNGNLLGFSIGEMCSPDCFDVHFEKADGDEDGAYPMVCREMARLVLKNHPESMFINREDDMGIEGLRQSKLSYFPEYLLEKYSARWRNGNT